MPDHNIELHSTKHKVLQLLKTGPLCTLDLHAKLGLEDLPPADLVSLVCNELQAGDVLDYYEGQWLLGDNGHALLNFLELKAKASNPDKEIVAALRCYKPPAGSYNGDELKVTSPRRGAYDFLAKPSRMGDEFVAHPTAHLANI